MRTLSRPGKSNCRRRCTAKIHSDFIAVNEPRCAIDFSFLSEGLILVPAELMERFKNDDQLAAVLADGIAYSCSNKQDVVIQMNYEPFLDRRAGAWPRRFASHTPGSWQGTCHTLRGTYSTGDSRSSAAVWRSDLMADAGYDPWQAPEAWRLLAPGKLPANTSHLKYPSQAGYQLAILNLIYKKSAPTNATEPGSTANPGTGENRNASPKARIPERAGSPP